MENLIFSFIPISTILLFFLKDCDLKRKKALNIGLVINNLIFYSPIIYMYFATPAGQNMWSEMDGPGAAVFAYIFLLPICMLIQFVLMTLKIVFAIKYKKELLSK